MLCNPSLTKDFELQIDASAVGLGAVLEQDGHVVAYASRSLTHAERQYGVTERECLAVLYAVKQFRHYLLGLAFVLHTDHQQLQWLSAKRWSVGYVIGYWHCRNLISQSNIDKGLPMQMLMPCLVSLHNTYAETETVPTFSLEVLCKSRVKMKCYTKMPCFLGLTTALE